MLIAKRGDNVSTVQRAQMKKNKIYSKVSHDHKITNGHIPINLERQLLIAESVDLILSDLIALILSTKIKHKNVCIVVLLLVNPYLVI